MGKQAKLFWVVILSTIGWIILMRPFTPGNIVQFELAKSIESAQGIIDAWGDEGVAKARIGIYLDFVFILLYTWAIRLGCQLSAAFSENERLIAVGAFFSRAIVFAGSCDLIENVAMLFTLDGMNELTVSMAFYFAVFKFSVVAAALMLIVISLAVGAGKIVLKK